jgi:hypothetical protein
MQAWGFILELNLTGNNSNSAGNSPKIEQENWGQQELIIKK